MLDEYQISGGIFEGGDGVGKHVLAVHTAEQLAYEGNRVLLTDFPQYWSPTGTAIRGMNREGSAREFLLSLNPYREAEVRCAMFALDRALSLAFIEDYYSRFPEAILISDRGPDSNCVTTAYMVASGNLKMEEVPEFLSRIADFDREFRAFVRFRSLFCHAEGGNGAVEERALLDLYEAPKPQEIAIAVYSMLGIPQIVTRIGKNWNDIGMLTNEAKDKLGLLRSDLIHVDSPSRFPDFLGPRYVLESLGFPLDDATQLRFLELIQRQEHLARYQTLNKNSKLQLDTIETEIAHYIANNLQMIPLSLDVIRRSKAAQAAIIRLVGEYPEIYNVLDMTVNSAFAGMIRYISRWPYFPFPPSLQ